MKLLRKNKNDKKLPYGFTANDIKIESSICTGERTIGFYDSNSKKLLYAELVKTDEDIAEFYRKYSVK